MGTGYTTFSLQEKKYQRRFYSVNYTPSEMIDVILYYSIAEIQSFKTPFPPNEPSKKPTTMAFV